MDGCCLRWNLASGDAERFATFASPLRPCSLSADGRRLLIASSSEARLLDMTNGAEIIRGPSATMNAGVDTVLSPQATCFAYAGPTPDHAHEPHLCNFSDDTTLEGPRRPLRALSFSHDGKRLAAGFAHDYDEKPAPAGAGILGAALPQRIYHEEPTLLIYDVTDKRVLDQFGEKGVSPTVVSFSPNGKLLAVGLHDNTVQVWDISRRHKFSVGGIHSTSATQLVFTHDSRCLYVVCRMSGTGFELYEVETGTKVRHFAGNHSQTVAVAPSLDDRRVACGGLDTFAFIWDATGVAPDGKLTDLKPDDEHLREWWDELAEKDASIGYAALWQLVASSDLSVAFLRSKLHPVPTIDMAMVDVWIANLDASEFEVREEATRNLERCGNAIESILNARANMAPTTEVQQRLTGLLARLTSTSDYRQRRRGICVLEKIGTQGAQELLKALAAGNPNDRLTQDARESLERLRSR
jgi:WD40 repeat protein